LLFGCPRAAEAQFFRAFYRADPTGAAVVPPTGSAAKAFATLIISFPDETLYFNVTYQNLGTPGTAVHVHGPAVPGANAPIVFTLAGCTAGLTSGVCFDSLAMTPSQAAELRSGSWYLDIHTTGQVNGEVRGQIAFDSPFGANFSPAQTVPPAGGNGFGGWVVSLSADETTIAGWLTYSGLATPDTGLHLHSGAPGVNGPVTHSVGPFNAFAGSVPVFGVPISPASVAQLKASQWYADVHNATYPDGLMRGQLKVADRPTDFDADGRAELGVFRWSNGIWYTQNPGTGSFAASQFGVSTDITTPADFDGDGKTDRAVWRNGVFYVELTATGALRMQPFGQSGDIVLASADYDHDAKADFAVYRPGAQGILYILLSSTGQLRAVPWGTTGDANLIGDFDGDREADPAVYRESTGTYYVLRSTLGFQAQQFGVASSDFVVPGDYDADGKSDFAVWRGESPSSNGVWYILQSATGSLRAEQFGIPFPTDVPVPADFDGDGRTDLAVARDTGNTWIWYVLLSRTGSVSGQVFGLSTEDHPIQFIYVR
jgi:hypothetical protein